MIPICLLWLTQYSENSGTARGTVVGHPQKNCPKQLYAVGQQKSR